MNFIKKFYIYLVNGHLTSQCYHKCFF